jgi:RHS repeat-associated protein
MPEVVEWVYRNGGEKDPDGCGEVCGALWTAEEHVANDGAAQEFWNQLGGLMTATGMWGSRFSHEGYEVTLHPGRSTAGWLVRGPAPKWVAVPAPAKPESNSEACFDSSASMEEPGYVWSPTGRPPYGEEATLRATAWVMRGCSIGFDGFNEYDEVALPSTSCLGTTAPSEETGEWVERRWWWNHCGTWIGEDWVETHTIAQGLYSPLQYGKVEEETGQEYALTSEAGPDPGSIVVQALTEDALVGRLSEWVVWVLEGEHGREPLGQASTTPEEEEGSDHESAPWRPGCFAGGSVNCATGNETKTQADLSVGGRGPGLALRRTYNSQLAVRESSPGPFGYGWTGSYSAHLEEGSEAGTRVVYTGEGEAVRFLKSGEHWMAVSPLVEATLTQEGEAFVFVLPDQTALHFNGAGQLTSEVDRNGNAVTLSRNSEGRLESVKDGAGRAITLKYDSEGQVESASDPMGHTVKYGYEGGNLVSVTEPGETSPSWRFKYNTAHELTGETDGRGYTTEREYDSSHRVTVETDPLGRKRKWEYTGTFGSEGAVTSITEPNGAVTREEFDAYGQPTDVTRGYGTSLAATTHDEYGSEGRLLSSTDPDGFTATYRYDAAGDRTSETNADGDETKWEYDSTHDITSVTNPTGEKTTIERDSHGNATAISRPAPGSTTQTTKYKYDSHGDVETMTNPLGREWKYEYDSYGDRAGETDPEGDKRTWGYNEDSQQTSTVSPRGHSGGAKESSFTTTIERDVQGRPVKVTDPLGHATKYIYDADGDLETLTDPEGHKTTYAYDADDEQVKVTEPSGNTSETEYSPLGQVVARTDGDKHTTKYVRNVLGEVTEEVDPLSRKTTKEYDHAGNLTGVTDAAKRTTTYKYDPANRLIETSYSDGKTPTATYEYNADGDRTKMTDGTGETIYTYDQLGRLTESKDGHGDTVGYEYDLANDQTKITYPNGKTVTRAYDKDGRVQSVTDWLEHTTKFAYDPDSDLASATFPANEDTYAYNDADYMSEAKMKKGTETLASLAYTRNEDAQITKTTSKGLPGEEKPAFTYDENSRLTKGAGTAYAYDAANNPTTIGSDTYSYDNADELEKAVLKKATTATYTYNEVGQRTKTTPATGPATSYGYDQAGNLTTVTRPKEGETPAIEDAYTYNGEGLRATETISGSTTYLAWDHAEELPTILSNGTYSYIYGPGGLPIEQINNSTGTVTYLHHDQAGSPRLLTGSTGKVEGKCTYSAYGTPTCEGTATTPLGFDGQSTSSDTGLIYMRHRVYDSATGQFLSVDPLEMYTGAPYNYVGDNPLNYDDPRGLSGEAIGEGPSCPPGLCFPFPNGQETERAIEAAGELGQKIGHMASEVGHGIESVWNEATGEGESSKESTQTQSSSECGEAYTGDQDALIKIAKEAKRNGLSPEDAETLREWAEEYDVPFRGPEEHPGRPIGSQPHIHVGSQNHIPVW